LKTTDHKLTIKNERSGEQEIFLFLPKKDFPDCESYAFRKVIKLPKR